MYKNILYDYNQFINYFKTKHNLVYLKIKKSSENSELGTHIPIIIPLSFFVFQKELNDNEKDSFVRETLGEVFCDKSNSPIQEYWTRIINALEKYHGKDKESYDYEISEAIICLVKHLLLKLNFTDGLAFDLLKAWQSYEELIFGYKKFYREHFIHQFQDFLLGCLFLGKLWKYFAVYYDRRRFLRRWFLAAMFHDVGYPAETLNTLKSTLNERIFDKVPNYAVKKIELETFNTDENLPHLIKNIALIHLFSENINIHENSAENIEKFKYPLNEIINLLKDELTESHDHGLVGALFFLKTALIDLREVVADPSTYHLTTIFTEYEPYPHLIDDLFVSAAAIAGHNLRTKAYPSYTVDFSSRPISALLNFCDDFQEWDRRFRKPNKTEDICEILEESKNDYIISKWSNGPIFLNRIEFDNEDELKISFSRENRENGLSNPESNSLNYFNKSLKRLFLTNLGDLNETFFKNLIIEGTCPKDPKYKINIELITKEKKKGVHGHMIGRYLINPREDNITTKDKKKNPTNPKVKRGIK